MGIFITGNPNESLLCSPHEENHANKRCTTWTKQWSIFFLDSYLSRGIQFGRASLNGALSMDMLCKILHQQRGKITVHLVQQCPMLSYLLPMEWMWYKQNLTQYQCIVLSMNGPASKWVLSFYCCMFLPKTRQMDHWNVKGWKVKVNWIWPTTVMNQRFHKVSFLRFMGGISLCLGCQVARLVTSSTVTKCTSSQATDQLCFNFNLI